MKRIAKAAQIIALSAFAAASHAALVVDLSTAQAGASDAGATQPNDVLGSVNGWYGANLSITGQENLTFELVGAEAAFNDRFIVADGETEQTLNNHPTSDETFSQSFSNGPLDFRFEVDNSVMSTTSSVSNGANPLPAFLNAATGTQPSFWVGYEYGADQNISAVLLALDDGAGRPDADFDDQVVRITGFSSVSAVPLPGSLGLLGAALAILGLGARRRARS